MEILVGASGEKKKSVPAGHQQVASTVTKASCTASSAVNYGTVKQHRLSWPLCTVS